MYYRSLLAVMIGIRDANVMPIEPAPDPKQSPSGMMQCLRSGLLSSTRIVPRKERCRGSGLPCLVQCCQVLARGEAEVWTKQFMCGGICAVPIPAVLFFHF